MAPLQLKSLAALLLTIGSVTAFPASHITLEARTGGNPGSCNNQSCEIATVAGSTGATSYNYPTYPTGDTQDGDCCIIRYFPASKTRLYAARPSLQAYCASHGGDAPLDNNPPGVTSINKREDDILNEIFPRDAAPAELAPRAATTCTPKILIFAKGTLETGDLGNTIGPSLKSKLSSDWSVIGSEYDNSIANDYCLALPGGVTFRNLLIQTVANCPNSVIALSGYSQGAMVVKNAIARAPTSAVAAIKNVITFGDPFDGSVIGQYSGPNTVFCNAQDGVCTGQFNIGLYHLAYSAAVTSAVTILENTK